VDAEHLTSPGTMVETVAYMSPEQVRAKELDARSDLSRLGSAVRDGDRRIALHGESSGVIFKAILDSVPPPPIRFNRDIPPKLEDIINKALEKDRNLRYQGAAEMRTDLQRLEARYRHGTSHSCQFRRGDARTGKCFPVAQPPSPASVPPLRLLHLRHRAP